MVNKKGFLKTLMTVALALMSVSVFATAPVISDPGDFIVGDAEEGITNNIFVFPDAFNFDGNVSDDNTTDTLIKWSFFDASGRYKINGIASFAGPDYNNPGAFELRGNDADTGHPGQDGSGATATLRNNNLSDTAGSPPYAEPSSTGVLPLETSAITLYASDCSTFSSRTIVLYSSNDASDSLSGGVLTNLFDHDYENNPGLRTGWLGQIGPNSTAGSTGTGTGFCMGVPGTNIAGANVKWLSPHNQSDTLAPGFVTLVDLAAYRFRATMYCDQTATGAIPFWTFGYNNVFFQPTLKSNIFGGDMFCLDVAGGANGIMRTQGRTTYDFWALPPPAMTDAWRGTLPDIGSGPPAENANGVFNASVDIRNDINVSIRILDSDAALNTNARLGTICLRALRGDRVSLNDLSLTMVHNPVIDTSTHGVLPDTESSPGNGTGQIRNATDDARFALGPSVESNAAGGRKRFIFYNAAGTSTRTRHYPLVNSWVNDRVYFTSGAIRSDVGGAAGTTEGNDPLDVIFMDWDTVTNELGGFHFAQKGFNGNMKRAASPRLLATTAGVPQVFASIFACQNKTTTMAAIFEGTQDRVRGYFDFQNTTSLGNATDGRDPFVVSSMQLEQVDISGF